MSTSGDRSTESGFSLIELMVVIAIVGIIAAIAIPNYLAYRSKTYCTYTETDANTIAVAIAEYFAIPTNKSINGGMNSLSISSLTGQNTAVVVSADPNVNITILVTDGSSRCPLEYQAAMTQAASPDSYWSNTPQGIYAKLIRP